VESVEPTAEPHELGALFLENLPDRLVRDLGMPMRLATCSCKPMARDLPSSPTPLAAAH